MKIIVDMCDVSREYAASCGCPPPFLRLLGRELVSYALSRLSAAGYPSALFCSDEYLSEISDYSTEEPGLDISCISPETLPVSEDMLILSGDCFFTSALTELAAQRSPSVLVCCEPVGSGAVGLEAENNSVTGISDRPGCLCFAGAVLLPKEHSRLYRGGLRSLLEELFKAGVTLTPVVSGFSARLTDAAAFLEVQRYLLDSAGGLGLPECRERVWSHSPLPAGAEILPPVYIGRNVSLSDGCRIGPYTVIDDDSHISRRVHAEASFIGRRASVGAHSRISGCCILDGVSAGRAVRASEGSCIGRSARIFDGASVCGGVSVYPGRKVFEGAYVCEDLVTGSISSRTIDDEGCCSLGSFHSPSDYIRFGAAAATAFPRGSLAVTAHSGTPASAEMCACLRIGLTSAGCRVLELGAATRQLLAFTLSRCGIPLGCYVSSGSEDSVTLMSPGGLPLPVSTERTIERALSGAGTRPVPLPEHSASGDISGFSLIYERWLRSMLPETPRVGVSVRCPDPQLRRIADRVFSDRAAVPDSGERLIFHIPQDGSACSVYSDASGYVMYDRLLLPALSRLFRSGAPAAVPYTCTAAADTVAAAENGRLLRYLISTDGEEDREARSAAARIDNLFVRDGLALAVLLTLLTERSGGSFAELAGSFPGLCSTQRYIGITAPSAPLARTVGGSPAGTGAVIRQDGRRAVIRRVKGSRGLMIYAEACSAEAAMSLCDEVTAMVSKAARPEDSSVDS